MSICVWTLKAGSGCSVTAALVAMHLAERGSVTLVDPVGDLAAVLGVADPAGAGLRDWIDAEPAAPADSLARVATVVSDAVRLVGPGVVASQSREITEARLGAIDDLDDTVIIDAGCVTGDGPTAALARQFARGATRSLLVTRPCYLALRRIGNAPVVPSAVVLLTEPGRALRCRDVEQAVGAPVAASIAVDPAIARAVDAGLLRSRPPRGVLRALAAVA